MHVAGYECVRLAPEHLVSLPLMIAHQCGQAFRWRKVAVALHPHEAPLHEWSLCLPDRVVFVVHDARRGCLYHRTIFSDDEKRAAPACSTSAWLHDYLSLAAPLTDWYSDWCVRDAVFARHAARFRGVRILRQDPWECLCAFICSSNNNIPRISQMVHKLCDQLSPRLLEYSYPAGTRVAHGDSLSASPTLAYHPFPPPTRLAAADVEPRLRDLGFGYRAKFIARTAQALCDRVRVGLPADAPPDAVDSAVHAYLASLRGMSYEEAREHLLLLTGVGPKVADCILLMSLDQPSSIPVDRHVFKFAGRWYNIHSKKYDEVAERLRTLWGSRAGWAHSVLFYADLPAFDEYGKNHEEQDRQRHTPAIADKKEEDGVAAEAGAPTDMKCLKNTRRQWPQEGGDASGESARRYAASGKTGGGDQPVHPSIPAPAPTATPAHPTLTDTMRGTKRARTAARHKPRAPTRRTTHIPATSAPRAP
ncbi:DNA-(apurinic or apyrimidinic site) lyase [Malassezia sp. CBS 17886]|nr:DNA-(apurinic or apyrimidinic site) lyase [Malassezia sp. CBS 17886]